MKVNSSLLFEQPSVTKSVSSPFTRAYELRATVDVNPDRTEQLSPSCLYYVCTTREDIGTCHNILSPLAPNGLKTEIFLSLQQNLYKLKKPFTLPTFDAIRRDMALMHCRSMAVC